MKVKFTQFYCVAHTILLHGEPKLTFVNETQTWEPDMSDMWCPRENEECQHCWHYDLDIKAGSTKMVVHAVEF